MNRPNPYAKYQNTAIETATPTRLVVMLYDGAIRFLSQALPEMQAHNYEQQGRYINKAQAIIAHLKATLNFEAGGAVAQSLDAIYVNAFDALTLANAHDKPEKVEQVIYALRELREAWIEVDRQCQISKRDVFETESLPESIAA